MEHSELIQRFVADLQIEGCMAQLSTLNQVLGVINPTNAESALKTFEGKSIYYVAGVRAGVVTRAGDADISHKKSIFVDFDVRKDAKEKTGEELTDAQIKDIGDGIIHLLNADPILCNWRYVIFSGNGIHLYFFGDAIAITSTEKWKMGMTSFLKLIEKCTGMCPDYGCVNAARIARLPGSKNCKNERHIPVEIIAHKENSKINIGLIEKLGQKASSSIGISKNPPSGAAKLHEGLRNDTLTSLAGLLRHYGHDEETILVAVDTVNERKCNPPLEKVEVQKIAHSVSRYSPSKKMDASLQQPQEGEDRGEPVVLCLADVETEKVDWLWNNRIPKGKIVMIEGDPGIGKSWLSLELTKSVTRGLPLPGDSDQGTRVPAKVLLLSAEDGPGDTIRPRLESIGGDAEKVDFFVSMKDEQGTEHFLSLEGGVDPIEQVLSSGGYGLIIIDPLNAYLGNVNTNNDASVRTVLMPLAALAEKFKIPFICIRHLTKGPRDKAIYKGQGSIGFTGAARAVHLVGIHPQYPKLRVIACSKNNLAPILPSIAFEIIDGRFEWRGEVPITAEELVAVPIAPENKSKVSEAEAFLHEALAEGARRATEIEEDGEAAGIAKRTLKRAREQLNIKPRKVGGKTGHWVWELPEDSKETKGANDEPWSSLAPEQSDLQLPPDA